MDSNLVIAAVCIGVALLILVGVALMARRATVRALVWWVGLACLPVGAWIAGMVPYLIDGWNRLAAWWQAAMSVSPLPPGTTAGLVVLGVGAVLLLGSRVIPHRPRKKPVAKVAKGAKPAVTPGRPMYDTASQTTPTDTTTH